MNYGLYVSASGVLTNLYRQDVYANNLANVHTAGFKADLASIRHRDAEAIEGNFGSALRHHMLDQIGGGSLAGPQYVDFTRGEMESTGRPLDLALNGADTFFAVGNTDPKTGESRVSLTRDGRFTVSPDGKLVTVAGGKPVLDTGDKPIKLTPNLPVEIATDGTITQGSDIVARLQVTGVNDLKALVKQGQNQFRLTDAAQRTKADNTTLQTGHVETSGVDPIRTMVDMINSSKAVTENANLIRYHDQLMDRAVNVLGHVA